MPTQLPLRPDLAQFKKLAKDLLRAARDGDADALQRITWHRQRDAGPNLADAQRAIAHEFGFNSWPKFVDRIERTSNISPKAQAIIDAVYHNRMDDFGAAFAAAPDAVRQFPAAFDTLLARVCDRSVWHRPQYTKIALQLLDAGITTDIWSAARLGLGDYVESLLDADPSLLEAKDRTDATPLQRAALIYGYHEEAADVAARLIDRGAAIDIHTAATFAMGDRVAELLDEEPSLAQSWCVGCDVLNWAIRPRPFRGQQPDTRQVVRIITLLLDHGADIEDRDKFESNMTPLMHAGEWSAPIEAAAALLDRGADASAKSDSGWTALDYAKDRARTEMAAFLRSRGCEQTMIDYPNPFGEARDTMIKAAKDGDLGTLRQLIADHHGIVNCRADAGDTPLHWAAHNGHIAASKLLIEAGADVNAVETNRWGFTVLQGAAERSPQVVQMLIDHGADLELKNPRTGQTALHYNARCDDQPAVTRVLLGAGADVNARDNYGQTPLYFAKIKNHARVAEVLRKSGGINDKA